MRQFNQHSQFKQHYLMVTHIQALVNRPPVIESL